MSFLLIFFIVSSISLMCRLINMGGMFFYLYTILLSTLLTISYFTYYSFNIILIGIVIGICSLVVLYIIECYRNRDKKSGFM